jgi:hypothetical protein
VPLLFILLWLGLGAFASESSSMATDPRNNAAA